MISNTKATIGRKVWYWSCSVEDQSLSCYDERQAFDATVIYVHPEGTALAGLVDLSIIDHAGERTTESAVELHDPGEFDIHDQPDVNESYATWMPYQKQQHDKQGETK